MNFVQDVHNPTREELEALLTDKLLRLNSLYWIRDKQGQVVPFRLNETQLRFLKEKHNRNMIPKARQKGLTTLAVINRLDDCLFISNFEAGIIAHSLDDAKKIFEKAKLAFERLPEWIKKHRTPETDTTDTYKFPNGSRLSVDTSYRSGTLSALHVSEMAKIAKKYPEKAEEIVTGAFEAVPLNGQIDVESTAEGMNGRFYELCEVAARNNQAELTPLDFKLFFEPWWTSDEYRLNPIGIRIKEDLKAYFERLASDHGIKLDDHQKAWYQKKADSLGDLVKQEYPSFYEEAFMASGRPVFSQDQLAADIRKAKERKFEIKQFIIKRPEKDYVVKVKVFEPPKEGEAYAIGADVAEGLEQGDSSTAAVYGKDYQMKAVYEGKIDPDIFGDFLVELGTFYNMALLAPELNNHGHATVAAIKRRGYYYVYKRVSTEELGDEMQDKIGWLNTVKSKAKMLDDFIASYRDKSLQILCEHTLRQMRTVTYEEDGGVVLNSKDLVVATGLAIQGLTQAVSPGTLGSFESTDRRPKFKSLVEMLSHSEQNEESYFD